MTPEKQDTTSGTEPLELPGDGSRKVQTMVRSVCKVEGKHVIPCDRLERVLNEDNSRKGVSVYQLSNVDTGKPTRNMICAYSGDYKKQGMILNFCPMCGTKISGHIE